MENLIITPKHDIPSVHFDVAAGVGTIEGYSHANDVIFLYQQIEHWLRDYATLRKPFTLTVKLMYFNTSSSKGLEDVFETLNELNDPNGNQIFGLVWYYDEEDEDDTDYARDVVGSQDWLFPRALQGYKNDTR